jgi:predicted deacylase
VKEFAVQDDRPNRVPQKIRYSFLKIMTGSDLSRRRLPFMAVESSVSGPVVWLAGGIHGDEVTGVVTIQEVFRIIRRQHLLKGSLYGFPLMNPIGFEAGSRNITMSREDLNRSFPGDKAGSLAERIADTVFTAIQETKPSFVLDLHNDWMKSMPYAVIDRHPGKAHQKAYDLAKAVAKETGLLMIEEPEALTGSISYSLLEHDVPALTLELGESYVVNEQDVDCGVKAVVNILAWLGMLDNPGGPAVFDVPDSLRGKILRLSSEPVSPTSGITRFMANPHDLVKKGQVVARIYNAFGKLQDTILALEDGIVLGHSDSSVAFPGAPIMAFGLNGDSGTAMPPEDAAPRQGG